MGEFKRGDRVRIRESYFNSPVCRSQNLEGLLRKKPNGTIIKEDPDDIASLPLIRLDINKDIFIFEDDLERATSAKRLDYND